MSDHYLKIFLKEEANVLDCLQLSEQLKANSLVEETYIFLDNVIDLENHTTQPLSPLQLSLQKKYEGIIKKLTSFRKRETDD